MYTVPLTEIYTLIVLKKQPDRTKTQKRRREREKRQKKKTKKRKQRKRRKKHKRKSKNRVKRKAKKTQERRQKEEERRQDRIRRALTSAASSGFWAYTIKPMLSGNIVYKQHAAGAGSWSHFFRKFPELGNKH